MASLAIGTAVGSATYGLSGVPYTNSNPAYWQKYVLKAKEQRVLELRKVESKLKYPNQYSYFTRLDAIKIIRTPANLRLDGLMVVSPAEYISDEINKIYQIRLGTQNLVREFYDFRGQQTTEDYNQRLLNAISDAISKLSNQKIGAEDAQIVKNALIGHRRRLAIAFGGAATVGTGTVAFLLISLQNAGKIKEVY